MMRNWKQGFARFMQGASLGVLTTAPIAALAFWWIDRPGLAGGTATMWAVLVGVMVWFVAVVDRPATNGG